MRNSERQQKTTTGPAPAHGDAGVMMSAIANQFTLDAPTGGGRAETKIRSRWLAPSVCARARARVHLLCVSFALPNGRQVSARARRDPFSRATRAHLVWPKIALVLHTHTIPIVLSLPPPGSRSIPPSLALGKPARKYTKIVIHPLDKHTSSQYTLMDWHCSISPTHTHAQRLRHALRSCYPPVATHKAGPDPVRATFDKAPANTNTTHSPPPGNQI